MDNLFHRRPIYLPKCATKQTVSVSGNLGHTADRWHQMDKPKHAIYVLVCKTNIHHNPATVAATVQRPASSSGRKRYLSLAIQTRNSVLDASFLPLGYSRVHRIANNRDVST